MLDVICFSSGKVSCCHSGDPSFRASCNLRQVLTFFFSVTASFYTENLERLANEPHLHMTLANQ